MTSEGVEKVLKISAGAALALVILGAVLQRLGWLPFPLAFYIFGLGLLLCALLALFTMGSVFRRLARKQAYRTQLNIGFLTTVPVALVLITVGIDGFKAPPIHDISTDVHDPPRFQFAQAQRRKGDNSLDYGGEELAKQQAKAYPDLKTVYLPGTKEQGLALVRGTVEGLGWKVLGEDIDAGLLEAADTTPLMGFTDDVVIRVRALNDGVLIDLRSVSRVGISDLGANARRIRRFVQELKLRY
ncbi:MAG TPA: DUF1499 domain-containing protein [Porticoccaceae bacterium]|nr:DUF1499 domain-containing protein [Porticoccaceae bacterium]